ncbi:putative bifunctional diguanylate cyclase/phosphodiesterase [Rhodovulum sp. DZ06]|uniref:putative bifunctional diguanylate cyclase/phosphodiesterase n=1 Tax=Rhodovulum sp. DZ06 TaxID=3425126 RepID=UPI003D326BA3
MSFRLKLILGVLALQAAFLAAFILGNVVWATRMAREQMRVEADFASGMGRRALLDAALSYDIATVDAVLDELARSELVSHASLLDAHLHMMAEAGESLPPVAYSVPHADDAPAPPGAEHMDGFYLHDPSEGEATPAQGEFTFHEDSLETLRSVDGPSGHIGWLRLRMPTEAAAGRVQGLLAFNLAAAAVGLAGLLAAALWFSGHLSRRILLLRDGADRIASGDVDFRLPEDGGDEISRAAAGFNQMSAALREERRRLDRRIGSDHLTGAANRIGLRQFLDRWRAAPAARGLALLHVDLDRFKLVNDTKGHKAGDVVLAEVTRRLRERTPETGIVARIGGDEFVLALPDGPDAELTELAEDLIGAVCEPVPFAGETLCVGASVGIARLSPGATEGEAELAMINADIALYASKEGGRGRVTLFDDRMRRRVEARARVVEEVRRGLEMADFLPLLQPQLRLCDGVVTGVETLARWRHPERGLVPPGQFMEAVGDGDLLVEIDDIVRDKACAWLAARRAARPREAPLRLGFNLPPGQLRDERTPERLATVICRHGIDAGDIGLEVREGAVIEAQGGRGDETLGLLVECGFHIELGAFGAGRASLPMLSERSVSRIRIDRSLVSGVDADPQKRRLVDALIGIGQALGIETLAEGVETAGELQALREAGCDTAQGYVIAHPMPPDELSDWLDARAAATPLDAARRA